MSVGRIGRQWQNVLGEVQSFDYIDFSVPIYFLLFFYLDFLLLHKSKGNFITFVSLIAVGTETSCMLLVAAINSLVIVSTSKTLHVIIQYWFSSRHCI